MMKASRFIRNKLTGKTELQYPHLYNGRYIFLALNDLWELAE